ncbi:MAG: hypothetical protein JNK10_09440 [Cyclobacteriaceae bacterium]|nr:hypothetical protein [Cyclobacteriaceae bacterium]
MKQSRFNYLIVWLLAILACSNDPGPQLPDSLYTISSAVDIGNNGDATDVRIEVTTSSALVPADILEVRLLLVKSSKSFSLNQIDDLKSDSYFSFTASTTKIQVIKPTASVKDSDGDAITNSDYKVYIAVIGTRTEQQLSSPRDISLRDSPIYAGKYVGTWEDLGPPGPAKFGMSLIIAEDYSGRMFYANTKYVPYGQGAQDALTTMQVEGTIVTAFVLDQFISGYNGGCPAKKTLQGNYVNDLELVLDTFSWADCDGIRDVKLRFKRQ